MGFFRTTPVLDFIQIDITELVSEIIFFLFFSQK